jgi:hypothetical protein
MNKFLVIFLISLINACGGGSGGGGGNTSSSGGSVSSSNQGAIASSFVAMGL